VLLANPPYGARIGEETALAEFYRSWANAEEILAGWRCHLFSGIRGFRS